MNTTGRKYVEKEDRLRKWLNKLLTFRAPDFQNRFSNCNFISPRYNRVTEGGRSFVVTATQYWNSLPAELKQKTYFNLFKRALRDKLLNEQKRLPHFNP